MPEQENMRSGVSWFSVESAVATEQVFDSIVRTHSVQPRHLERVRDCAVDDRGFRLSALGFRL